MIDSRTRYIRKTLSNAPEYTLYHGNCEMDSHADTCVAGRNCVVLHYTERACDVMPYSEHYEPVKAVPIATVATGYTASTGLNYILVVHEALWMPQLEHSLLNPNQLRYSGVQVQDNPFSHEPLSIRSADDSFALAMLTQGASIYFRSWSPSRTDLQAYPHINLTSDIPWNPTDLSFPHHSTGLDRLELERSNLSIVTVEPHCLESAHESLFDLNVMNEAIICSIRIATVIHPGPLHQDEIQAPRNFISTKRHTDTTPEDLSELWGISVQQAQMTLHATTQHHVRSALMPLSRRYRVDRMFLPRTLRCIVASDTMDLRCESLDHNRHCQVFGTKFMFAAAYPIRRKADCDLALKQFITDWGAPIQMITDGSREQTAPNSSFRQRLLKNSITPHTAGPYRPNSNPAETVIREIRKRWYRTVFRTNCPRCLWNYAIPYICRVMSHTASNAANLGGRTPVEALTGDTPDISELLDFAFYDRVWHKENAGLAEPKLGRFLGISHQIGNLMSFWILPESGIPISCTTVSRVTPVEAQMDMNKDRFRKFDESIGRKFKEPRLLVSGDKPDLGDWAQLLQDDEDFAEEFAKVADNENVVEADDEFSPDTYDQYLNSELALDRGGEHPQLARVTKRLKDKDGLPIGTAHSNPLLDTRLYEVEFLDGHSIALSANVIATNIFAQVDSEGHRHVLFDTIIDVRRDGSEVKEDEAFIVSSNGVKRRKETTRGWEILVQWKDGSTTWNKLKDLKQAYPVELAEYAVANRIDHFPAFAWWVPYTLKKKARIVSKIKSKYWSRTHKYGIRIPKTVKEALEIDEENGNTLWWDALMLEMKNVRPAFEIHEGEPKDLVGYQKIRCHVIWDVKLGENFRRKARLVAGGHTTEAPSSLTYSSVVTRESVRIALTIAALNEIDLLACDIQNAYLTAECREKIYTIAGPEFGSEQGKVMIVKMALYGLKSSGAAFHSKLANHLWDMQFRPSRADPDVWMRPAVKPNGFKYYEFVLCYVDDVIAISHQPSVIIDEIKKTFKLKGDKAEEPDVYLGAQLQRVETANGTKCWTMSADKYVKMAIKNVEEKLAKSGVRLPTRCHTPMTYKYHPAEDTTKELNEDGVQYFQELIGVLRWAIEIGRVDILYEVSLLSSHLALPRVGHLHQAYHIFGYLKESPRKRLFMDPDQPAVSENRFHRFDWEDFYKDAKEEMPPDMPEPRGKELSIHCFVDAGHAADKNSRRSQTGVLIFCNRAPISWYSKRQNAVETSTFGSELTAMKTAVEMIKALRYKLRMFGVPLEGPARVYCDNESAYKNVSIPDSTLNKKHHSIAYHFCREAVAAGIVLVAKEDTSTNLADLFTKSLPKVRRDELLDWFAY